jgi:phosphopentomutase
MRASSTALVVVLDAVGISTLNYLLEKTSLDVSLPNMSKMGLPKLLNKGLLKEIIQSKNTYAKTINQASATADSAVGHREMMGIVDDSTYELFPHGFKADYIKALEEKIGTKTLFNKMVGGMDAIRLNAEEHEKTGYPIVYASKCDPLLQLAMDENVIPVKRQHEIAEIAFNLSQKMGVPITRVIGRAYVKKENGEFVRTSNRHDVVCPLESKTLIDILNEKGICTVSVGKAGELVNTEYCKKIKISNPALVDKSLGLRFVHPKKKDTNPMSIQGIVNALDDIGKDESSAVKGTFVFANLVDTDSLYGHSEDVDGAIRSIEESDRVLSIIKGKMKKGDLLAITADHGMEHRSDYGYHNLEPIPLLAERIGYETFDLKGTNAKTLADVGYLVAQLFKCENEFIETCKLEKYYG